MKEEKKKSMVIATIAVAIIILFTVWILRVIEVNKSYHRKENYVGIGEDITYEVTTYNIEWARIYDLSAFVEAYPDIKWLESPSYRVDLLGVAHNEYARILLYSMHVKIGEVRKRFQILPTIHQLYDGSHSYSFAMNLVEDLNNHGELDNLASNMERTILVPVWIWTDGITDGNWERLTQRDIGLEVVIGLQPEKTAIRLDNVEYISGTDEAEDKLLKLVNQAEEIENAMTAVDDEAPDKLFYDDGKAVRDGIQLELHGMGQILDSEIDGSEYEEQIKEIIASHDDGQLYRDYMWFWVDVTFKNVSDSTRGGSFQQAMPEAMGENDCIALSGLEWIENPHNPGTKSVNFFLLKPGESIRTKLLYSFSWGGTPEKKEELLDEERRLFSESRILVLGFRTVGMSGMQIDSINDRSRVFITTPETSDIEVVFDK